MDENNIFSSQSTTDFNIQPGDLLFWQDKNTAIKIAQKGLTSSFASATHTGVVTHIDHLGQIHILEALGNGVKVNVYNQATFKTSIGKGIHLLRSNDSQLCEDLAKIAQVFDGLYKNDDNKTKYAYDHLINCVFQSIKDSKKGRKRTVYSLEHGQLMTSKGKKRKASICSELVSEVVKIAQMSYILKNENSDLSVKEKIKKLKSYQKDGFVLNLTSQAVSPAELEKTLTQRFKFETIEIKPDDV